MNKALSFNSINDGSASEGPIKDFQKYFETKGFDHLKEIYDKNEEIDIYIRENDIPPFPHAISKDKEFYTWLESLQNTE